MARNLFAILDDLTANLAELKATLAPLALIGGTVVSEARKPASAQRRAKVAPPGARGAVSAKRRAAMRVQGQYMSAIRTLSGYPARAGQETPSRKGSRRRYRARTEVSPLVGAPEHHSGLAGTSSRTTWTPAWLQPEQEN